MRRLPVALVAITLMAAPVAAQSDPTDASEAIVNRVIDGSTLDASVNGQRLPIAYLGVEAPPANQPCGQEALARNRELAGQRVLLMTDPQYEFDVQGRRLYYVFTIDGVSIDQTLANEGLAHAVRTDAVEGDQVAAAEAAAATDGRGCLWGA